MAGAANLISIFIVAAGAIGIVAAFRFFLLSRRKRPGGQIDFALLIAQCICSGIALFALTTDLAGNMSFPALAIQTLEIIVPVTATLMAQIAMFSMTAKR